MTAFKSISSRHNPLVARFRAAAHNEDETAVLLDGVHLVAEAIDAGLRIEHAIVGHGEARSAEVAGLLPRLENSGTSISEGTSAVLSAVSPVRSSSEIVALARRPRPETARIFEGSALVVIACGVQDPGNVGAIVRVAEAAGATGLLAAGPCADPFSWKALRGSMGSALRLPIAVNPDEHAAVEAAKSHGCRTVAAVPRDGERLFDARLAGPLAILVGSEGQGLSPALVDAADLRVTIPMAAAVESLNTAVSAALLLYEAMRQRL